MKGRLQRAALFYFLFNSFTFHNKPVLLMKRAARKDYILYIRLQTVHPQFNEFHPSE
jgi:hypothetical protein